MKLRGLRGLALVLVAALCGLSGRLGAQGVETAVLRGTVRNANANPLVYAVITIPALSQQQFTNAEGRFYFVQLKPGKYVVTIRQLGYSQVTREVTLTAGTTTDLPVEMTRIATRLATMNVSDKYTCTRPGRPRAGEAAEMLEVFEQLEQNAVRLRLMNTEFPSYVLSQRKQLSVRSDGTELLDGIDSIRTESATKPRYKPGELVQSVRNARGARERYLQIPTLLDFADNEFQKQHCFVLRGVDTASATPRIRVDFYASDKLRSPDIEGTVLLEQGTFRIVSSEIRLTRIPSELRGLVRVSAMTYFQDVVPGLPMVYEIHAESDLRPSDVIANSITQTKEQQKIVEIRFLKNTPPNLPATAKPPVETGTRLQ